MTTVFQQHHISYCPILFRIAVLGTGCYTQHVFHCRKKATDGAHNASLVAILKAVLQEAAVLPRPLCTLLHPLEKVRRRGQGGWRLWEWVDPKVMAHTMSYPPLLQASLPQQSWPKSKESDCGALLLAQVLRRERGQNQKMTAKGH